MTTATATRTASTSKTCPENVDARREPAATKEAPVSTNDRNDISTEPSPGPEDNDNLGAEDGKGTPPTVPPTDKDAGTDDSTDAENPGKD
jgi:hypothetical protein